MEGKRRLLMRLWQFVVFLPSNLQQPRQILFLMVLSSFSFQADYPLQYVGDRLFYSSLLSFLQPTLMVVTMMKILCVDWLPDWARWFLVAARDRPLPVKPVSWIVIILYQLYRLYNYFVFSSRIHEMLVFFFVLIGHTSAKLCFQYCYPWHFRWTGETYCYWPILKTG